MRPAYDQERPMDEQLLDRLRRLYYRTNPFFTSYLFRMGM